MLEKCVVVHNKKKKRQKHPKKYVQINNIINILATFEISSLAYAHKSL
jgi:hypothetical protein